MVECKREQTDLGILACCTLAVLHQSTVRRRHSVEGCCTALGPKSEENELDNEAKAPHQTWQTTMTSTITVVAARERRQNFTRDQDEMHNSTKESSKHDEQQLKPQITGG